MAIIIPRPILNTKMGFLSLPKRSSDFNKALLNRYPIKLNRSPNKPKNQISLMSGELNILIESAVSSPIK